MTHQHPLNRMEADLKPRLFAIFFMVAMSLTVISCSKPVLKETTPEQKLNEARKNIKKSHYEKAYESLQELRLATAGTRLGGEAQFLMGETDFERGKYPEAESNYAAYLNNYPDGPFTEQAIFKQAMAKVKQIQRHRMGLFKTYIPYDRDISLLKEAKNLFALYLEMYPNGQYVDTASQEKKELHLAEGMHQLEIANFYLKKNSPASALARAKRVLDGSYPERVMVQARDLVRKAQNSLDLDQEGK